MLARNEAAEVTLKFVRHLALETLHLSAIALSCGCALALHRSEQTLRVSQHSASSSQTGQAQRPLLLVPATTKPLGRSIEENLTGMRALCRSLPAPLREVACASGPTDRKFHQGRVGRTARAERSFTQSRLGSGSRCAFVNRFPDLGTELRRIVFPMNRHSVLYRSLDQFILPIRGDSNGAFHFAREFSAVNVFACHRFLLEISPFSATKQHTPAR